jgi:hypothetical protein
MWNELSLSTTFVLTLADLKQTTLTAIMTEPVACKVNKSCAQVERLTIVPRAINAAFVKQGKV